MSSGGSRVRSGLAPDPNALSREYDSGSWTILPARGRCGEAPAWPLTAASERELAWWALLWTYPQAEQWERLWQVVEVAIYVRRLVEVECGSSVAAGTLLRQLADGLGLSVAGMLRLRWHPARPAAPAPAPEAVPRAPSSRGRFTVIPGGEGA